IEDRGRAGSRLPAVAAGSAGPAGAAATVSAGAGAAAAAAGSEEEGREDEGREASHPRDVTRTWSSAMVSRVGRARSTEQPTPRAAPQAARCRIHDQPE